jgi:hypothetical protein
VLGHVGHRHRLVEGGEQVGVGRGDEVFQHGRRVGAQVEGELLHAILGSAPGGQGGDISAKIRVCLRAAGGNPRQSAAQGPLM